MPSGRKANYSLLLPADHALNFHDWWIVELADPVRQDAELTALTLPENNHPECVAN